MKEFKVTLGAPVELRPSRNLRRSGSDARHELTGLDGYAAEGPVEPSRASLGTAPHTWRAWHLAAVSFVKVGRRPDGDEGCSAPVVPVYFWEREDDDGTA